MLWADKNYHSFDFFFKNKFGSKVAKLSLDIGLSCPNRDGTLSTGGCIFCGAGGSGDFAAASGSSVTAPAAVKFCAAALSKQLETSSVQISAKWPKALFMPYFQAFTNTYGDPKILAALYNTAAAFPGAVAVSIATRPDCLSTEILSVLEALSKKTFVIVELGLQTSNERTAVLVNRCYENFIYEQAVKNLKSLGIHVVTHLILGLPGETKEDILTSVRYVCRLGTDGIKLQLLHILTDSRLYESWLSGGVSVLSLTDYCNLVVSSLEIIPQRAVIHRLTGDAPRPTLAAPLWSLNKKNVLNTINKELKSRNTWQGKFYSC